MWFIEIQVRLVIFVARGGAGRVALSVFGFEAGGFWGIALVGCYKFF